MATNTTVNAMGDLFVLSRGTATEITVSSGGRLYITVAPDTYIQGTSNGSAFEMKDAFISGYTVDGGNLYVASGGTANSTTVNSYCSMDVSSGGTATAITVSSGGWLGITVAPDTYIQGTSNGSAFEMKDAFISGYTVDGGNLYVASGGTAKSTTVNSLGLMYVSSGGTATEITVSSGGALGITVAPDTYIQGTSDGSAFEMKDALISGYTVNSGGSLYVSSDGTANSTTVNSAGSMYVLSGGTAHNTTVNGGFFDPGFPPRFYYYGNMVVSSGGTATNTTVNSLGLMYVSSGGTAVNTLVNSGGSLYVSSGGTAMDIVWTPCEGYVWADNGAYVTYASGCSGVYFGSNNQLLSSAIVMNNKAVTGSMYIFCGGTANSTTVNSYGSMVVLSGGTANSTTVNNGNMYVSSGGKANNTVINSGGLLNVASGGIVTNTTVNSSGRMDVSSGITADNTVVNSGGLLNVASGGIATNTTINYSGRMDVSSGGIVTNTTVNSSGSINVTKGVLSDTLVSPNGFVYVMDGGLVKNVTVDDSEIILSSGGKVTGRIMITNGGLINVSRRGIVDFDLTQAAPGSDALINDLTGVGGSPTYTVTVTADQNSGTYKLAEGAFGFNGTISLGTAEENYGIIAVNDAPLTHGEQTFTLTRSSGSLTLTVTGPAPAGGGIAGDLNADGRADIVMTIAQDGHPADGSTGAWLILEDQTAAWGDLSTRNPGWEIFGTGKTAVGKNTDDVYIKSSDNVVGAWTTADDGKVNGWETIGEFSADTQIVGLGDFNGNGQTDLLLRNTNGAVGCFFTSDEKHGWNYFQSLGDEWKLSAVGDLNGDGRDDVVLKHDAGFAGSWLTQADGTMAWADLDTLPDGFEIVGAGDFNADGTDDVLLKSGNYYGAWLVNNGNAAGWMGLGDLADVTVEQIADFNGDGTDDLRIRTAAGDIGTQLVMGEDNLVWKYYGSVGSEWSTALAALA